MTLKAWLEAAAEKLAAADISTARLDCLVLLEDATGKERGWLLAHPELELDGKTINTLDTQIEKRSNHEPLAYVRHKTEFFGRDFYIDHRVLEPRPESETMLELLSEVLASKLKAIKQLIIVDIGTGSGALAITAKLEFPSAKVIGTDIDKNCILVARHNARLLKAKVEFFEGNLLEPVYSLKPIAPNLIVLANLPYVPNHFQINPAAMNEPRIAIFGGNDGLDIYRGFFKQIQGTNVRPRVVFTESMPPQHEEVAKIAGLAGYRVLKTADFIQVFVST